MRLREYPINWPELSTWVRDVRDLKTCQICNCKQFDIDSDGFYVSVLQVAHLDHDKTHNWLSNLLTMCLRCHNRHDKGKHIPNPRL